MKRISQRCTCTCTVHAGLDSSSLRLWRCPCVRGWASFKRFMLAWPAKQIEAGWPPPVHVELNASQHLLLPIIWPDDTAVWCAPTPPHACMGVRAKHPPNRPDATHQGGGGNHNSSIAKATCTIRERRASQSRHIMQGDAQQWTLHGQGPGKGTP